MSSTIFEQIIAGSVPCHRVYEDELTLAFLDIHPVQPGHTLVIPKQPVEFVWDLEPELYAAVMTTVQKVAKRLKLVLEADYIGAKIVGVDVPHGHVHLIPFTTVEQFNQPQSTAEPDHQALAAMAQSLRF